MKYINKSDFIDKRNIVISPDFEAEILEILDNTVEVKVTKGSIKFRNIPTPRDKGSRIYFSKRRLNLTEIKLNNYEIY